VTVLPANTRACPQSELHGTPANPLPQSHIRLHQAKAADEIRTRDPELGKLVLYQLSYRRTPRGYYALRLASRSGAR
jgi:hypothetical protein